MSDETEITEQPEDIARRREGLIRAVSDSAELRAAGTASDGRLGTLVGRMLTYGEWAEVNSRLEGRFMESTAPGAFTKTIAENRSRLKVIFDHGTHPQIGRLPIGPLDDIIDDGRSADYMAGVDDTSFNRDLIVPGLRSGVFGSSYRMDVIKDRWVMRPAKSATNPEGLPERTVLEAKLKEIGPTPFPVNHGTFAGIRSMTDEYERRALTDEPTIEQLLADPEHLDRIAELVRSRLALPAGAAEGHSEPVSRAAAAPVPVKHYTREEFLTWLSRS